VDNKLTIDQCLERVKHLFPDVDKETILFWRRHHLIPYGEKIGLSHYYDLAQFGEWIGYILFLRDTFNLEIADIKRVIGVKKDGKLKKDINELLAMTKDFDVFKAKMEIAHGKRLDPYSLLYATRLLFTMRIKNDWDDATLNKKVKEFASNVLKID